MTQAEKNDRTATPAAPGPRPMGWILLILLVAAGLRLVALPSAPPGMTHDEADHGLTAWGIVNGARDIYFTVGYGREPLYDYATALLMAGTGPTIFAARVTSVYFSLLMIAAVYAWARRAFGAPVALLSAAGLAVGFWPVMAGRQALRSIALPAVFAVAVLFFWRGWTAAVRGPRIAGNPRRPFHSPRFRGANSSRCYWPASFSASLSTPISPPASCGSSFPRWLSIWPSPRRGVSAGCVVCLAARRWCWLSPRAWPRLSFFIWQTIPAWRCVSTN
ncbi:MAG TPA: glycosyltransferase family 39 protein [Promineifilum sp.]|nr:glycosyltransferase family 39 protein [Promineifilum sp.]